MHVLPFKAIHCVSLSKCWYFKLDFCKKVSDEIDRQLIEIYENIDQLRKIKIDTKHLDGKKTRLLNLQKNLSEIIDELNKRFSLDISKSKFDENIKKLIEKIKGNWNFNFIYIV